MNSYQSVSQNTTGAVEEIRSLVRENFPEVDAVVFESDELRRIVLNANLTIREGGDHYAQNRESFEASQTGEPGDHAFLNSVVHYVTQ